MPRHRTISDEALLDVARTIFKRDGHTASTREIAKHAGISQAVLYQRFGSKEELFYKAMIPPPPDIDALLGSWDGAQAESPKHHLLEICQRIFGYFYEIFPSLLHLMTYPAFEVGQLRDAHGHLLASALIEALTQRLAALSEAGLLNATEPNATAHMLFAFTHNAAFHSFIHGAPQEAFEKAVEAMFEVAWQGIKPQA